MKMIKYSLSLLVVLLFLSSCSDFLDVNSNPTKVSVDDVNVNVLLPTVITGTSSAHYSTGYYASRATHQMDLIKGNYYSKFTMDGAWQTIYLRNLNNIDVLIAKADEENSPHFAGVAKALKAVNIALLTDCWENAPYSEALQGSNNVAPGYDSQEALYGEVMALLDEALTDLGQSNNFRALGAEDFVYGGDVEKWTRLVHSLKARYMLHLSSKVTTDWNALLTEVSSGLQGNEDDFELVYTDDVANPWYSSVSRKILESIYTYTYGQYFMNMLNGTNYPVLDPRIDILTELNEAATEYVGLASWIDDEGYSILPTVNTYYMGATSPIQMMSYAELKFIEAEAALNSGNADLAGTAYTAGVTANLSKLGVDEGAIDTYINDPSVAVTDLEHIMKEKYIALVLHVEAWNDMRRHNYDASVYKNFVEPDHDGRSVPAMRAVYPGSEESRNNANYKANLKEFTEKMWKDN